MWNLRHCITVLFEHSDDLSVWGWYYIDILWWMPVSFISIFQNLEMKILSQSEMISKGHPFSQYHLLKNRNTNSLAVVVVVHGTIWMSALRWSVMVASYLKDGCSGEQWFLFIH